ncbi:hypothetical protein [Cellulomonas iranensis]|uniref:hypothetical protein n=1 Tax=Cellulomonas iranensis TaxID=76862 RepID=UPI003D7DB35B
MSAHQEKRLGKIDKQRIWNNSHSITIPFPREKCHNPIANDHSDAPVKRVQLDDLRRYHRLPEKRSPGVYRASTKGGEGCPLQFCFCLFALTNGEQLALSHEIPQDEKDLALHRREAYGGVRLMDPLVEAVALRPQIVRVVIGDADEVRPDE